MDGRAVHKHGARAAVGLAAPVFRARQAELGPQHPQETAVPIHVQLNGPAIEAQGNGVGHRRLGGGARVARTWGTPGPVPLRVPVVTAGRRAGPNAGRPEGRWRKPTAGSVPKTHGGKACHQEFQVHGTVTTIGSPAVAGCSSFARIGADLAPGRTARRKPLPGAAQVPRARGIAEDPRANGNRGQPPGDEPTPSAMNVIPLRGKVRYPGSPMNPPAATRCAIASLVVLLTACSRKPETGATTKPAAVELVPEAERSRHFDAVNSHLELGGTLYAYADVDGDVLAIAGNVQALVRQIAIAQPKAAPFARQDFKALFTELGLNDVKAIGLSSVREAGGSFRNRAFLYTPDGRHGIFAVFGGQPGRFVGARLAPADTDFYGEHEFDVTVLYDTVKSVVAKVNGPDAAAGFEEQVKK